MAIWRQDTNNCGLWSPAQQNIIIVAYGGLVRGVLTFARSIAVAACGCVPNDLLTLAWPAGQIDREIEKRVHASLYVLALVIYHKKTMINNNHKHR